jgi:transposase
VRTGKDGEQLELQALHRVRYRLVGQRTAIINQIRSFLLEHSITVRQRLHWLRHALQDILARRTDVLSPRMVRILEDLAQDWHRLDDRIEAVTGEIETLSKNTEPCRHLMTIPGVGPIISSAVVAAIGNGVPSHAAAILLLGSVWSQSRYPRVIERSSGASPSAAIATFACSSCRPPASFCYGQGTG